MSKKESELPILLFADQPTWEAWLEQNHAASAGVRLRLAKKQTDVVTLTYQEALESALCYGWIDSRKEAYDESTWLQRFTPRGAKSIWSKVNKDKAEALIASGRMQPPGLRAIEAAKQNGQWDKAYESQSRATVPDDLQSELDRNPQAKAFFETLDSQNRYAILFRVHSAKKAETRAKRIQQFVAMLERGEKIYP
ncbi:YdeI/OmpD-associated family protein [Paenibacillus oleatilyticus]|uniref:YdeI/OmpD-associated family protein n=1 Tax=Paenibacillus oleatilyticus TaxID=2594886 RepID=UPI001C1FBAEF|nr:YdeI/OmpD-associated family protein [Paenibacillus oleatilyticus]MBU7319996.1 YdeI/OmpD-associated family protein [Paenibacillus oleatilyticus]